MEQPKISYLRSFGISLLCWTIFAALLGAQLYGFDRSHQNFLPLFHYVIWPALMFFPWALLTPLVLAFGRRYPITRANWMTRLWRYGAATLAFTFLQAAMEGFGGWLYTHEMPLGAFILNSLRKDPAANVQICVTLFGLGAYFRLGDEAKYRQVREAQLESRVASAELEMLRIQLHPHFLFNTLQAATVLLHEDPQAAEDVLLRLSELLRVALDEMRNQEVPLEQELAFLDLYAGIQKQRFKDRLQILVRADSEVLRLKVPSLILQPLVENAVHHGIGKHKGVDTIEVSAQRVGTFTELEVRNYSSSLHENGADTGHGLGLRNTRARLDQMYGDAATLELRSIVPRGVSAFIRLPSTSMERTEEIAAS
jgi:two-component system, LytTR family, sensor kinase